MIRWLALVAAMLAILAGCDRIARFVEGDVPAPRNFMQGGVWFPAATGYWFHQYLESDELRALLEEVGLTCSDAATAGSEQRLRCERGFRFLGGTLSRNDFAEFTFRRNGAIASAESGCRYAWFDAQALSGACRPYAAPGAVYPGVDKFAVVVEAMLRPARMQDRISVYRMQGGPPAALPNAQDAVDRLARWRFECDTPRQQYTAGFRGRSGEIGEAVCRQSSLRTPGVEPQSQQVIVRYDSADGAVLDVAVRLDGESLALAPALRTQVVTAARSGERPAAAAPGGVMLETRSGERFEMPVSAVGTGSRKETLDGFATLTPESQRVLLQAYLDKMQRQWTPAPDRLSYANPAALEWYGEEALPHLEAMLSDERPLMGAALLKYLCFQVTARGEKWQTERTGQPMAACLDRWRADMPNSVAMLDRLLAQDLRGLESSEARALNAFFDFRRDVFYVYALGPDARASAAALETVVAGKQLDTGLQDIVTAALAQRDRR